MLLILFCSCTSVDDMQYEKSDENIPEGMFFKEDSNYYYVYDMKEDKYLHGKYYQFDKTTGIIAKIKSYSYDTLNDYIKFFDKDGRLFREALYSRDSFPFWGNLIEDKIYDSKGNIDYEKSNFLEVIPSGTIINVINKPYLPIKLILHYNAMIKSTVIVRYNAVCDTLRLEGNKVNYTLKNLCCGDTEVSFDLLIYTAEDTYSHFKTYRTIRNWGK